MGKLGRVADKLWSEIVRSRGECEVCSKRPPGVVLQGAHGFSRRYRGTRWLPINGFCLCSGCHVRYTHDPLAWDDFLRENWGALVREELRGLALLVTKRTLEEMEAIVETLRAELAAKS